MQAPLQIEAKMDFLLGRQREEGTCNNDRRYHPKLD
jgi:hypothetical protein